MKKIIAILFSSLMFASLVGCSAADDSTITSPRMSRTIESYCFDFIKLSSSSSYTYYYCNENGLTYECSASDCDIDD